MTSVDRRFGVNGNLAFKAPVAVATTANITLSGEQTIDGVLTAESRVLVRAQTTASANGLYDSSSGAWTRCIDANGNRDLVKGTAVYVAGGSTLGGTFWAITTANPITVGTSSIAWTRVLASAFSTQSFTQAGAGAVERAAQDKMRDALSVVDFMTAAQIADVSARTALVDVSAAWRLATDRLIAMGGGILRGGIPGKHRVFSDTGVTTPLGAFSSIDGITLDLEGVELVVDRAFSGSQTVSLFTFADCDNVRLLETTVSCSQVYTAAQLEGFGAQLYSFTQGCKNIKAGVTKATGIRRVWSFRREIADPISYVCHGIDLGITYATRCAYPLFSAQSAYGLKATLITDGVARSYFPSGGRDHDVHVVSRNHVASVDCLIVTDGGDGMDGLRLSYTNTESTTADNSINCVRLEFQDGDVYAGTHRNIDINLNIKTTGSAWLGFGFSVGKFKADDTEDATDRGHVLENLRISGSMTGGSANQRTLNVCGSGMGTWSTGESIRNFNIEDLVLTGSGQPTINLASLKNSAHITDFYSSAQVNLSGTTTKKIVCTNVDCDGALTSATSDTSLVDYISCSIGSTTLQSVIGKTFVNTYWGSVLRNGGGRVAGSAVSGTGTVTAAQIVTGSLVFSGGAGTQTLPTAVLLAAAFDAAAGTEIEFSVDNTAGSGTCTIAVGAGMVAATPVITGGATLTVGNSATQGVGLFRIVFSSATACVLFRIG